MADTPPDPFFESTIQRIDELLDKALAMGRKALRESGLEDEWEPEAAEQEREPPPP